MKEENEQDISLNLKTSGGVVTNFIRSINSYILIIAVSVAGFILMSLFMIFAKYNTCINKAYQSFKKSLLWTGILGIFSLAYMKCLIQFFSTFAILYQENDSSNYIQEESEEPVGLDGTQIFILIFNILVIILVPSIGFIILYRTSNNDLRNKIY